VAAMQKPLCYELRRFRERPGQGEPSCRRTAPFHCGAWKPLVLALTRHATMANLWGGWACALPGGWVGAANVEVGWNLRSAVQKPLCHEIRPFAEAPWPAEPLCAVLVEPFP